MQAEERYYSGCAKILPPCNFPQQGTSRAFSGQKGSFLLMAASPDPLNKRRLDSWKEIAAFFARAERTVKRWEAERGLPVHRVPGGGRSAVFAYSDELGAWLKGPGRETEPSRLLNDPRPEDPEQPISKNQSQPL